LLELSYLIIFEKNCINFIRGVFSTFAWIELFDNLWEKCHKVFLFHSLAFNNPGQQGGSLQSETREQFSLFHSFASNNPKQQDIHNNHEFYTRVWIQFGYNKFDIQSSRLCILFQYNNTEV
jgi:hypothetical protein